MVSLPQRERDSIKNAEIDRLLYQFKVIKLDAQGLTGGLTREQFNWRPQPDRWSVAQCVDHLNITNRRWISCLEKGVSEGRTKRMLRDGPYAYGLFSRWFLRLTEPPVKTRFKAPKSLRPPSSQLRDDVMLEFIALHDRIEQLVQESDGLDLVRIKVSSPVASFIRYSLGMAFWIITAHDRRHLWQTRQLLQDKNFPKAEQGSAVPTRS